MMHARKTLGAMRAASLSYFEVINIKLEIDAFIKKSKLEKHAICSNIIIGKVVP